MGYTENIADFGHSERKQLIKLLEAWDGDGLPDDYGDCNVRPAYNSHSGKVFLVNEDYQTLMLCDGELREWHNLPYGGAEGFLEDLIRNWEDHHVEDQEYLIDRATNRDKLIVLRVSDEPGTVCYSVHNEEFGVIKSENEAWFPTTGHATAFFIDTEDLPSEEDEDSEDEE